MVAQEKGEARLTTRVGSWVDSDAFISTEKQSKTVDRKEGKKVNVRCIKFEMLKGHSHK